MIQAQVLVLALAAFSATTANGAAIPARRNSADAVLVRDINHPSTVQTSFQAERRNTIVDGTIEARDGPSRADVSFQNSGGRLESSNGRQQNASQDDKNSKGDKDSGKSGPDAVASAVAAAGDASPTVTNDKGVQPLKTDKAESPSKTGSSDQPDKTGSSKASSTSSDKGKGQDKAADAAPTAAASKADASDSPSPTGTWTWQAGAFGCPDQANPKGTKHACTATSLSAYTATDGAQPSPAPSSSSQKSSKSEDSNKSDKGSKSAVKQGGSKKKSTCSDETEEEDDQTLGQSDKQSQKESSKDDTTKSEQGSPSSSKAVMSANDVNDGPVPSSNSTKNEDSAEDGSSPSPARVNIPASVKQVKSSRVMIPVQKRSFQGTMEEKQQKWQELKAMDTQIKKLRKTLLKEKKKQEKQKSIPVSKPQGSFAAKTVLNQDLKAIDNQINQLKVAMIHGTEKPQEGLPAKMIIGQDLKAINSQVIELQNALIHEFGQPQDHVDAKMVVEQDLKNVNFGLNELKHALQQKVDAQMGHNKEQRPFIQLTQANAGNVEQSKNTHHNQISAEALDEATRPRFTVSRPRLCSFVSWIFASIGLIPMAVLALLRKQSKTLFYGTFASLITACLATLYVLENTLIYHNVLPSTFSLAYLAMLGLQTCFALLIRTPTLPAVPKGYLFLGSMTREEAEEEEKRFSRAA